MKITSLLFPLALFFAGCATDGLRTATSEATFPVDGHSKIELATHFKFMPSLSGYYLPPGVYEVEKEYSNGVMFPAPKGAKSLSLAGATDAEGGIFLPKEGSKGVRGYAYIILPLLGRSPYFLPDDFFSQQGKKWRIINPSNQSPETTPGAVTPPAGAGGAPSPSVSHL